MNQNQNFNPGAAQAPNTPASPKQRPSLWTGAVMIFVLIYLAMQRFANATVYLYDKTYCWLVLAYEVALLLALMLIVMVTVNPLRKVLGSIGWWLMLLVSLADLIPFVKALIQGNVAFDSIVAVADVVILGLDALAMLCLAFWMQMLVGFRKRMPAFFPAVLSGLNLLIVLGMPILLVVGEIDSFGYDAVGNIMPALLSAMMFFFAGYWMKAVSVEYPAVDPYQKIRDRLAKSNQSSISVPYGKSSQAPTNALPAYGQTTNAQPAAQQPQQAAQPAARPVAYGQPAARPMAAQPQQARPATYAQPASVQPGYARPAAQPTYAQPQQPAYAQPQQAYAQPAQVQYAQAPAPAQSGKWLAGYDMGGAPVYLNQGETIENAVRSGSPIAFTANGTPISK